MDASQLDWESDSTHWFVNPRLSGQDLEDFKRIQQEAPHLPGHIWIQSSGTERVATRESLKWIALSKQAFLSAASAVNHAIRADSKDCWGLILPIFHVGGLSIYARAHLSKARVVPLIGDVRSKQSELDFFNQNQITHSSVVPTQLYDWVQMKADVPASLKCLFVGGGAVSDSLYRTACESGWPLRLTYGMTEVCSQIALSDVRDSEMKVHSHMTLCLDENQCLGIQSPALMTGMAQIRDGKVYFDLPFMVNGFYQTQDVVDLKDRVLVPRGRLTDFVKIKGEGVSLLDLRGRFEKYVSEEIPGLSRKDYEVVAVPDDRSGYQLQLWVTPSAFKKVIDMDELLLRWNNSCFPIERMTFQERDIKRTTLGKIIQEK